MNSQHKIFATILSFLLTSSSYGLTTVTQDSFCCRRVRNIQVVGHDVSGRPVKLDIGRCATSCTASSSEYQSVLERILEKKTQNEVGHCSQKGDSAQRECTSSMTRMESVTLNTVTQYFDVIESCECRQIPKSCERTSKTKKFFAGTKFETVVDVGQCEGGCRNHKHHKVCRETRTETRSIRGPNGIISIETIAECRCEQACYRQHFNVAVTELAHGKDSTRTKIIDVGKCVGTCGSVKKCVVKDHKRKGAEPRCLMALESNDVKCAPTRIHDVPYTNTNGEISHVTQIRKCGCT